MKRASLVGILIFGLIFVGLLIFNNNLLAVAFVLITYLAAGLIFSPQTIDLHIERQINPQRASPDTPIEITLAITNHGSHLEEVFIKDVLPSKLEVISGQSSLLAEIKKNETIEISYQLQGRRGIYYFDMVNFNINDRLAIYERSLQVSAKGSIFITPHIPKIKHVAIRPRQTRVYSGSIPARVGGTGVEFFGVREYQEGDTMNRINWKASARHQESLYSNEFQVERVTDVGLILDARQICDVRTPQGTLFEHQISATAALADTLISEGNRVGLLVYGQYINWTYPGYGKIQRERILQALVRAQIGDSIVFKKLDNLPTKMFPSQSQLIFFSPLREEDVPVLSNLRAHGYYIIVISADPIQFQMRSLLPTHNLRLAARLAHIEREIVFNKLRRAGVVVLNWDVTVPFAQAMQLSLRRLLLYAHHQRGRF